MKQFIALLVSVLPVLASADPLQVTLTVEDGGNEIIHPTWEKENRELIVPLTDKARKGSVNPAVEEGLIAAVGTRFVNAMYENATASEHALLEWKCFDDCAKFVVESVPCLFKSIGNNDDHAVLECVPKDSLCNCASCLPNNIEKYVNDRICKSSIVDTVALKDKFSPYVDFMSLSSSSVDVAAFRGDLYQYQVEQLKSLNRRSKSSSLPDTNDDPCAVGGCCHEGCDCCCVGVCGEDGDTCFGVCT